MQKTGERRGYGPAPALLVRHMEKVAATLPRNRSGVRDLALMTLHFAVAGREQELAWLRVRDDLPGHGPYADRGAPPLPFSWLRNGASGLRGPA
ncbi:hypothetical protein [Streptomyces sp. NPDC004830]